MKFCKIYLSVFIVLVTVQKGFAQQPADLPTAYPGGTPVSFVRTWDATAPEQDGNTLMTRPLKDVKMTTQYFDGLGRPMQTVVKQGALQTGVTPTDLVNTNIYDDQGRERIKYLPYAELSAGDGSFKTSPFTPQANFYTAQLNGQTGETSATSAPNWAYSQTNFEASPLGRPTEAFAPGVSWVGTYSQGTETNRRSVKSKHWINTATDNVRIWIVTDGTAGTFGTYATSAAYAAGQLLKNVIVDERGYQVIEFKDKDGKVILKKVQVKDNVSDAGTGSAHENWLCTYYIYDQLGQLRCVIQPEAVKKMTDPNPDNWDITNYLDEQCFRYEYDQRGRMILKKVPGAGHTEMIYDAKDRMVISQDAVMQSSATPQWLYTQYDESDRPVATGIYSLNTTANSVRTAAADKTDYPWAHFGTLGVTPEILSNTYYDHYNFPAGPFANTGYDNSWAAHFSTSATTWPYPQLNAKSNITKDRITGSRTKILGTSDYLYTANIYDEKGRIIQVKSTNITGGTDVVTTQYTWAGQPYITVQRQTAGAKYMDIVTRMNYDDLGRIVSIEKKHGHSDINGGTVTSTYKTIVQNEYDKLGQLKTKKIGSVEDVSTFPSTMAPLEVLSYDYNIRGWMLGMNRDYITTTGQSGNKRFGFELGYDKLGNSSSRNFTVGQYNGNITGMVWKSDGDDVRRKYDFTYDPANRLMKGLFEQDDAAASWSNSTVNYKIEMGDGTGNVDAAYDANGNIKQMQQWGLKLNSSNQIDNLSYQYINNSNKLLSVTELSLGTTDNKLGDFTDKNTANDDYSYDVNGNLTLDKNKSISNITYNYLNLPLVITVTGKGTIAYTYAAGGTKLRKVVTENGVTVNHNGTAYSNVTVTTSTSYIAGSVYETKAYSNGTLNTALGYADKLQFAGHEEGRIRAKYTHPTLVHTVTGLEYDYMIKDHLGNVRMVLTEEVKEDNYPTLSFEGAGGSPEVSNQNAVWENAAGNAIDVEGKRTAIAALQNATSLVPATGTYSLLVRSSTGKIGAGKLLKVMSGDKIHTTVQYYYSTNAGGGGTSGLNTLLAGLTSLLTNSVGSTPVIKDGATGINTALSSNSGIINYFNNQSSGSNNGRPKAFLNVLFFDEQFKFDAGSSYSEQIGSTPNPGQIVIALGSAKQAVKNGYCYVYISNETDDMVYFDNFTLKHERSVILEETHYYPFGLVQNGISSKAAGGGGNKKSKYNGYELSIDFDINLYESFYRTHDPQIGRFMQVDPKPRYDLSMYAAMDNNPILMNDLLGDTSIYFNRDGVQIGVINRGKGLTAVEVGDNWVALVGAAANIANSAKGLTDKQVNTIEALLQSTGTVYDITSFEKFGENANKFELNSIEDAPIDNMTNIKINGKSASGSQLKAIKAAEAFSSLVFKNGKWTVEKPEGQTSNDLKRAYPLGGSHIHTHSAVSYDISYKIGGQNYSSSIDAMHPGLSGDQALAKRNGKDVGNTPRNVTVTKEYIYLINGNYDQTIRIKR